MLIEKHDCFGEIFLSLAIEDQEWILNYMCSDKGVIPYEMMNFLYSFFTI